MNKYQTLKEYSVVHITTAHQLDDVRIYHREAKLIAPYFKKVYVCASGTGNLGGVEFLSWGENRPISRKERIKSVTGVIARIKDLKPDIIHFHDPEFLLSIKQLRNIGEKIVYDIHEYYSGTLYENSGGGAKGFLAKKLYEYYEWRAMKLIDGIVTVTPQLVQNYEKFNKPIALLRNFPDSQKIIQKLSNSKIDISKHKLLYSGSLEQKSLYPLADAIKNLESKYSDLTVTLIGDFKDQTEKEKIYSYWKNAGVFNKLNQIGRMSRENFINSLKEYSVGLVLFWPTLNAQVALPNKLFEYMAASLPVIVPDLPNQREVVKKYKCGAICNTSDALSIAKAIDEILSVEDEAVKMGLRGRESCLKEYNAEKEIFNLLDLYLELLKK